MARSGQLPRDARLGWMLGVSVLFVAFLMATYAAWFYWEFGAPPGLAGQAPPRIRWCGGGETFAATGQTRTDESLPPDTAWQSAPFPAPYSWRAIPPKSPTAYSGLACPMELYLKSDGAEFLVYARSGGP